MPILKGRSAAVCFAVAVAAVMLGASWTSMHPDADDGEYREYQNFRDGLLVPSFDDLFPSTPSTGTGSAGTTAGSIKPLAETSQVVGLPNSTEIKRLAELEGKQNFTNVLPSSYNSRSDLAMFAGTDDSDATKGGSEPREVEEADVIKLVGDVLYVLNPYRGLMVFDLSHPDSPRLLGRAAVLGDPVDMYVLGETAYIVVSASHGYWYRFITFVTLAADIQVPNGIRGSVEPSYYIGTQVVVVDLADLGAPAVVKKFGIQGFVTDSRRVGEVLYFVSAYHSWYYYNTGDEATDRTYVISLDMTDAESVRLVDKASFPGAANIINVTEDAIFVAQSTYVYDTVTNRHVYETTITYVDISDPHGSIRVRDSYTLDGYVSNKYQINYFDGTLRVVSHYFNDRLGSSELWVLDVSRPDDIQVLGRLLIDDAGTLMATRFAGTRAYTIHLPRSIDPLDVLDLSDPRKPKLCDVLEMPGWVTHIEVRGMKLIALGVDNTEGTRVAVSLFNVEDPYEAVLLDRVRIGESYSWSGANFEPKALTVLDDKGLVLVPYGAYQEGADGSSELVYGLQLVEFDLERNTLRLAGMFEQPDSIVRTRSLGDRVLATSTMYLQVVDVTAHDTPTVTATVELCPRVLDVKVIGAYGAMVVQGARCQFSIHVSPLTDLESIYPLAHVDLGDKVTAWQWDGLHLRVASWTYEDNRACWEVVTVDFSQPLAPQVMGAVTFASDEETGGYYPTYYYRGWNRGLDLGWDWGYDNYWYSYYYPTPRMLSLTGGLMALYLSKTIYVLDLSDPYLPRYCSKITMDTYYFTDVRAEGSMLYVTDYIPVPYSTTHNGQHDYVHPVEAWFHLNRFDLSVPYAPRALPVVNIPGVPGDVADQGEVIYTTSTWWNDDGSVRTRTLNVVRLDMGVATLVTAVEIPVEASVSIEHGIAYVSDVVSTDHPYDTSDGDTHHYYTYSTNLKVIALWPADSPTELTSITLQGTYDHLMVEDGVAMLVSSGSFDVLVLRTRSGTRVEVLGLYEMNTLICAFEALDDYIVVAQGVYGTSVLALA